MPFITKEHRENPDFSIPGDRCYERYKFLVDRWRLEPRWSTVDSLYADLFESKNMCFVPDCEFCRASTLAWQVFFQIHVMPYELKKREENGDI